MIGTEFLACLYICILHGVFLYTLEGYFVVRRNFHCEGKTKLFLLLIGINFVCLLVFVISVMALSIDTHFLTRSLCFMYFAWFPRIRSFVGEVLLKDYLEVSYLAFCQLTSAVIIHVKNRTLKIKPIQFYFQLISFFILCFQLSVFLWWEQQSRYNEKLRK